ncbi:MAG: discoidin domain-containing protein, partial [Fusobacteriaceae bacterium]
MSLELTFIRNGNDPNGNLFNLKLNSNSVIKNLILESQNNLFPSELEVYCEDFIGNEVILKSRLIRTLGNIQEWELDPVLTSSMKVKIPDTEASIINVTPILTDVKPYYAQDDVDTRIPKENLEIIQSMSNKIVISLKESKIIDRVKLLKNIPDLEIFYTPGEGQDWIKLANIEIDNTLKLHPIMAKAICFVGSTNFQLLGDEFEIFMFNYLSVEIENLFLDNSYTSLKPEITMADIEILLKKTNMTSEYLEKIEIAKNILMEKIMPIEANYKVDNFRVFQSFEIKSNAPIYRVIINYEDCYGNKKTLQSDKILNSVVTFDKFYSKDIKFTIYGIEESSEIEIIELELNQENYYSSKDEDTRLDKATITATSGCGTYASLVAQRAIDGDERTNFHSTSYGEGNFGDVYFNFSNPQVIDRVHILTRPNSLGRIENYKILYKERTTEEWIEIGESINEGIAGNWRNTKFDPIFAQDICIRVTRSNENYVIIYETEFFKYNTLEDKLKDLFTTEECLELREGITIKELDIIEALLDKTEEYIQLFHKAKELYINSLTPMKYLIDLDSKNVVSLVKFNSKERVFKTLVKSKDEYGYEKISEEISRVIDNEDLTITFENFYAKSFELNIFGEIKSDDISNISVIPISQKDFYEDEDVDVRLDKNKMTAKSLCGQYSSGSPNLSIDGDENTAFHSDSYNKYGTGEYGDLNLTLGGIFVVDRIKFTTRLSGNGRIKAYEILYKTKKDENWNKVFEQLVEENGSNREGRFKPVLASEICIRVTNGHNNFMMVNELDLFKFNLIEERISNLFFDKTELELKDSITLEEIEELQNILITEEYKIRVQKAKELYIKKLIPNTFLIPLNENTVFDKIQFLCEERILKAEVSYKDTLGNDLVSQCNIEIDDAKVTLNFKKLLTSNAALLIYGAEKIYGLQINSYEIKEFCINEDIDARYKLENANLTATNEDPYYPLVNIYDGDLDSKFHSKKYSDNFKINIKLDKEYIIDSLNLMSFNSGSNGLINKFKVFMKTQDVKTPWVQFGGLELETPENKWLEIKNNPYFTDEIYVVVEQSKDNWVIINELELFIYNTLNDDIKALFEDTAETVLKDSTNFETILALEERCKITENYKLRVQKAKDLYLERLSPVVYKLKTDKLSVFNSLDLFVHEKLDYLYSVVVKYVNTSDVITNIENIKISEKTDCLNIEFDEVVGKNIEVFIYLDEYEKYKINSIKNNILNQSLYYDLDGTQKYYSLEKVTPESRCGITNPIENMMDDDKSTYFQSSSLGDIIFKFEEKKLINEFKYYSKHTNGNNGKISKAKLLYREDSTSDWKLLLEYNTLSPFSGENIFEFNPTLMRELCFRIESITIGMVVLNTVAFRIYSKLEDDINDLFEDKVMFKSLKKDVSLRVIENLNKKVALDKELKI